jgi:Antirepressor regulating drug resistance, predicted signal transduction N-terminal membrane component
MVIDMDQFLTTMLSCSIVMSVISLLYMVALPYLQKRYSAKWLYYIWLMVVFGWVFPLRPYIGIFFNPSILPRTQVRQGEFKIYNEQLSTISNATNKKTTISALLIIILIWALVSVGMIVYQAVRHYQFLKMIDRWSNDLEDRDILMLLNDLKEEMGIKNKVSIKTCPMVASPMMIGFFHPTILMPSVNNETDELAFILRHELCHLKRKDLWYKALVLISTSVHWFNPVIYYVAKSIEIQCEISCDEMLMKRTDFHQRKRYGETLIGAVRKGRNLHTALSTDFYSKEKIIKTRIFRVMDTTKKSAAFITSCLIFIAVLGSGAVYASNTKINDSKTTQIINIDVKTIEEGHLAYFEGPFELKAGDKISYDITSDNNANLYVDFIKKDNIVFGTNIRYQLLDGYIMPRSYPQAKVNKSTQGEFCVLVKFRNLQAGGNIKGTIKIIRGEEGN